jgi:hypothetical protein
VRRRWLTTDHHEAENYWPSFADLISTIALIQSGFAQNRALLWPLLCRRCLLGVPPHRHEPHTVRLRAEPADRDLRGAKGFEPPGYDRRLHEARPTTSRAGQTVTTRSVPGPGPSR